MSKEEAMNKLRDILIRATKYGRKRYTIRSRPIMSFDIKKELLKCDKSDAPKYKENHVAAIELGFLREIKDLIEEIYQDD